MKKATCETALIRGDWRHRKIALLERNYGEFAERWTNLFPPVRDDRRLYINIYNQLVEAVNSLPDNPNTAVCVAMNRYISEETKTLDAIIAAFLE